MPLLVNMPEKNVIVGWREWAVLPDLGIPQIKAKIDTGARTSALHAFEVLPFRENGKQMVRFSLHPYQRNVNVVKECVAEVADQRWVTDSGGHREKRYLIVTTVTLGEQQWQIEVTLTNRDNMKFRMLLGRTAMENRFIVDPGASYLVGKRLRGKKA
jgi:hypothetical protein